MTTTRNYQFENLGSYQVLVLHSELNNVQWGDIEKIGNDILQQFENIPKPNLLVDLTSLNYMGSAMVALVVRVWKSIKEKPGQLVVVNRDENVYEVLKLSGLNKVWTIVGTREEAQSHLGVSKMRGRSSGGGGTMKLVLGIIIGIVLVIAAYISYRVFNNTWDWSDLPRNFRS